MKVSLNDGRQIPQLGLGTWPLDDQQVEMAVNSALALGYRHIDTAVRYGNEIGIGRGIRGSGIPREDLWVTTKLDGEFQGNGRAADGLRGSLNRLRLDYVDLLMIHWPLPQRGEYLSTWETFIELRHAGLARSIGVSNFKPAHIDHLAEATGVVPAVNQLQLSPAIPRRKERDHAHRHGVLIESWSPLGGAEGDLLSSPQLARISAKHGRTPAQVILRWHIQQGLAAVPKSADPQRMAENLDVFRFELDSTDMSDLELVDEGHSGVDSDHTGH